MFRFSESTTSSYIIHSLIFGLFFLTSLFLVIPTKNKEQITEIEFIIPQIESKKPPPLETKRRSTVQSIDQGKHDPKKDITAASKSRPLAPPIAVPKLVQRPITPPKPVIPQPKVAPKPMPRIAERPGLLPEKAPAPIQETQNSQDAPQQTAPAPEAVDTNQSSTQTTKAIAVLPRVPGSIGGIGNIGNPPPNTMPGGPTSLAAKKDLDFGPYMNELQRRIKRAWRPPRGNESKRVIVIFKISTLGELSDLAIKGSSGAQEADQAALIAVQAAAPFNRLPEGAPSKVDIEFTFDYNVFGTKGSYRQY